ncbi:MAG TPA: aldehyde ferredoxin oxidoreductase family protein [Anaerolineaceae bacterium]
MASCYTGSILHVDLSKRELQVELPPEEFYRKYGGGSAMGLTYLLKGIHTKIDAFSPENILTLFTGLPTGLPISGQSRLCANALSPLTGAIGDGQAGGFFPAALKFAGFDGIVVRGCSDKPVYLYIKDGEAELRDASHLWGRTTGEVEDTLRSELGGGKMEILQIGPAGERLVRYACIINMKNRANGRTGMGAVMGSKRLKAVVVQGNRKIDPADKSGIFALQKEGMGRIEQAAKWLALHGTANVVTPQHLAGTLPTCNYNMGQFTDFESLSGEVMSDTILKERDTCFSCLVRCKRVVETEFAGRKVFPEYGGPEYETLATFGSYCGIADLSAVSLANQICNMYGLDTISCGATIAFAMECFENGLLTLEETGGIDLRFGNAEAMIAVLDQIVARQGLGDLLAEGSERAAQKIGRNASEYLITSKGQEAPAHMPQAKRTLGLIYSVNPFGADHMSSEHDPAYELPGDSRQLGQLAELGLSDPQPKYSLSEEKVRFAYLTELVYSACDSYCLCQFVWGPGWQPYGPQEMLRMLQAATGWDITINEILDVGARRLNMMRQFNARQGMGRKQDNLPRKYLRPLQGTGPTAGVALDAQEYERAKDQYFKLAGWDVASGNPTQTRLAELGLEWTAD